MSGLPVFNNPILLLQALTHSSYVRDNPSAGPDYERLEFLGDSVLEFVVRDLMFSRYPTMAEGEMSKRGDQLVDETRLAALSVELGIPPKLRLGHGAQHERNNPSVQADALEAIIGAYRLDAGLEAVYQFVESVFGPLVDRALELRASDPVTEFQEYVHAYISPHPPVYKLLSATGPDHAKVFEIGAYANDKLYGIGQGRNKKEARRNAAINALEKL